MHTARPLWINGVVCALSVIVAEYLPADVPAWVRQLVVAGAWYGCVAYALACGHIQSRSRVVWLTLAVVVLVGLELSMQSWVSFTSGDERRAFLLGRAALISLATGAYAFILAWPVRHSDDPYPVVFRQVWRLLVDALVAMVVGGVILILLAMLVSLLSLIGVPWLEEVVYHFPFWSAALPLVFTAGLVLIRRHDGMADLLRRYVLTLVAWLLPLVVVVTTMFVAAMAVRAVLLPHWGRDWTFSLGFLIACWIALVNVTWQDGTAPAPLHPKLAWLMQRCLLALPVMAALPVIGILLRVEAYGWTPPRIWGLVATGSFLAVAMGYAYAAYRASHFARYLGCTNVVATAATMLVIVVLSLPGFNVARLVPPEELPPAYLTEPPPALPDLIMLPAGSAMDPELWTLIAEDFAWMAFECADTVAAASPDKRCVAAEIAPSTGEGPLVAFLPQYGDMPPQAWVKVFGKVDGTWRDSGTISLEWLLAGRLLPPQKASGEKAEP